MTQAQRTIMRAFDFGTGGYNMDYMIIGTGNDCLHSDAFGIPQYLTQRCTSVEINQTVDNMIEVGEMLISVGITPVYSVYPKWDDIQLSNLETGFGLMWTITESNYNLLRDTHSQRIAAELPSALLVDTWEEYSTIGDGIHPDETTTFRSAGKLLDAMNGN